MAIFPAIFVDLFEQKLTNLLFQFSKINSELLISRENTHNKQNTFVQVLAEYVAKYKFLAVDFLTESTPL